MGRDFGVDDLFAQGVGECAFEAVADLHVEFVVLDEDEEDGAVVFEFLADFPGLGDADGVVLDGRIGLHFGVNDDDDLVRRVALELFELLIELLGRVGGHDVCVVVEIGGRGRRDDLRGADDAGEEQDGAENKMRWFHGGFHYGAVSLGSGRGRGIEVELHFGRSLCAGVGGEIGFGGEAHCAGIEEGGEGADGGVVLLDGVVESAALDGDAVFGAFELGLQLGEILGGVELGIIFGDGKDPHDGSAEFFLGLLELREFGGVGRGGVGVDAGVFGLGAGFGNVFERGFFEVGSALDGLDEVGNEVQPALVDVLDLGPLAIDGLGEAGEAVVAANDGEDEDQDEEDDGAETAENWFFHGWGSFR